MTKAEETYKNMREEMPWSIIGEKQLKPYILEAMQVYGKYCAEKLLPTDEELKEQGNLTYRALLRALNLKFEKGKVTFSEKELHHWFETGQHLKEWKEWDTL